MKNQPLVNIKRDIFFGAIVEEVISEKLNLEPFHRQVGHQLFISDYGTGLTALHFIFVGIDEEKDILPKEKEVELFRKTLVLRPKIDYELFSALPERSVFPFLCASMLRVVDALPKEKVPDFAWEDFKKALVSQLATAGLSH